MKINCKHKASILLPAILLFGSHQALAVQGGAGSNGGLNNPPPGITPQPTPVVDLGGGNKGNSKFFSLEGLQVFKDQEPVEVRFPKNAPVMTCASYGEDYSYMVWADPSTIQTSVYKQLDIRIAESIKKSEDPKFNNPELVYGKFEETTYTHGGKVKKVVSYIPPDKVELFKAPQPFGNIEWNFGSLSDSSQDWAPGLYVDGYKPGMFLQYASVNPQTQGKVLGYEAGVVVFSPKIYNKERNTYSESNKQTIVLVTPMGFFVSKNNATLGSGVNINKVKAFVPGC